MSCLRTLSQQDLGIELHCKKKSHYSDSSICGELTHGLDKTLEVLLVISCKKSFSFYRLNGLISKAIIRLIHHENNNSIYVI